MRSAALFLMLAAWQSDWNTAFRVAKEQRRLVFVDYYANACKPCSDIERIVLPSSTVRERLRDFILLKVDTDLTKVPASRRFAAGTYVVFDPGERERFLIGGEKLLFVDDWHDKGQPIDNYPFWGPLEKIRLAAPAFLKVDELLEAKQDLDASFLLANTYSRLKMTKHARAAYADARRAAEARGDKAAAQLADVQSAFTWVHEGKSARSIELLAAMTRQSVSRENEALIWLTLGEAYEAAAKKAEAIDAYTRAQSAAVPDSRAYTDATKALARLRLTPPTARTP